MASPRPSRIWSSRGMLSDRVGRWAFGADAVFGVAVAFMGINLLLVARVWKGPFVPIARPALGWGCLFSGRERLPCSLVAGRGSSARNGFAAELSPIL